MNNRISIIVPIYNVEKYLKRCIESILSQSFKEFELILVNDGSTDGSGEICNKYLKLDNRIKVIHKENGGLSSARNAGIEIATGEYIAFVDSDDYIHSDMYKILYDEAIKNDSEIVICDYIEVFNDEQVSIEKNNTIKNFDNISALNELYSENSVKMIVAWNKLYKKSLFKELRYKNKIHEDEFIAHKILYNSNKTTYVDCKLYYYFQRSDSIMGSKFNIKRLDLIEALEERIQFLKECKLDKIRYKCEYDYAQNLIKLYYKAKSELEGCEKKLKYISNSSRKILLNIIIKNPYYNIREKVALLVFLINKQVYKEIFLK